MSEALPNRPNSPEEPIHDSRFLRFEPWLYAFYAACATCLGAWAFFDSRAVQLSMATSWTTPEGPLPRVTWSAPLDDVFIHFDFARSLANFRFFEWTPGGGYSSGATSWTYPMLLAVGIWLGADGAHLGPLADALASVGVLGFLLGARTVLFGFPRWTSYLVAPMILMAGVLGWSLWSGMELALFLGLWAGCLALALRVPAQGREHRWALGFGAMGLLLVGTRPEALLCVFTLALLGWTCRSPSLPRRRRLALGATMVLPAVLLVLVRAMVNRWLTGDFADAGALAKLLTLHPYLEFPEMLARWASNVGFQFVRITSFHAGKGLVGGIALWLLVGWALYSKRTRPLALLLGAQALLWILLVAWNEYVRYQNDRYTTAPFAWLTLVAILGLAELATARKQASSRLARQGAGVVLAGCLLASAWPELQQQRWFFGRACRNIAEQQIRVGQILGRTSPRPRRVLLGDAGAIPYFSGLSAVDALGLGGTQGLPFARAGRLGVGATVELIERLAPRERPDVMALYPSWWDNLPLFFGHPLLSVSIDGNVICGARTKVIYQADWRGLQDHSRPATLAGSWRILDEVDFADLVSETTHAVAFSERHSGYVGMKLLPDPADPTRDLFDAGRLVYYGVKTSFTLRGLDRSGAHRLVFRLAAAKPASFRVHLQGRPIGDVATPGGEPWQEPTLSVPKGPWPSPARIELVGNDSEHMLHHLWLVVPG